MKRTNIKGNFMLMITAVIWGSSFVAQKLGVSEYHLTAANFNGVRTILGGMALLPVIFIMGRKKGKKNQKASPSVLITGGIICGILLCLASTMQTLGMSFSGTDAGKAGFITALYIIIVPVIGIFLGKRINWFIALGVALATAGMYLLCISGAVGGVSRGDIYVFISAILFSLHILTIDYFSPRTDGVKLSCIQFFVSGSLNLLWVVLFDKLQYAEIIRGIAPILYSGIMSCGIAYTLQIIGQKYTDPTSASLIMSLESVFAAIFGAVIIGELMSGRQTVGCVLMFVAIILVQLPPQMFKIHKNFRL